MPPPYKFAGASAAIVVAPAIQPLNGVWKGYEKTLRKRLLNPIHRALVSRVRDAGLEYDAIRNAIQQIPQPSATANAATRAAVKKAATKTKRHHTARFRRVMGNHLGVNVGPMLPDTAPVMRQFLKTNVDLIKTIPKRKHAALLTELTKLAGKQPLDQQALESLLSRNFKSAGYNLRRLTRDQTQKLNAQFDRVRQQSVGVTEYRWRTVGDERVRDEHASQNGQLFAWKNPPSTGHPGDAIQCRCLAEPVIPKTRRTPLSPERRRRVEPAGTQHPALAGLTPAQIRRLKPKPDPNAPKRRIEIERPVCDFSDTATVVGVIGTDACDPPIFKQRVEEEIWEPEEYANESWSSTERTFSKDEVNLMMGGGRLRDGTVSPHSITPRHQAKEVQDFMKEGYWEYNQEIFSSGRANLSPKYLRLEEEVSKASQPISKRLSFYRGIHFQPAKLEQFKRQLAIGDTWAAPKVDSWATNMREAWGGDDQGSVLLIARNEKGKKAMFRNVHEMEATIPYGARYRITRVAENAETHFKFRTSAGLERSVIRRDSLVVEMDRIDDASVDEIPVPSRKFPDIDDASAWEKTGPQRGSNPGGVYRDQSDARWYVKRITQERAESEKIATDLYRKSGLEVPEVKLVEMDGNVHLASRWVDRLKQGSVEAAKKDGGRDGFLVDAWLANWDVAGLDMDNLAAKGTKAFRLDAGGALRFRAQGALKPNFGRTVDEFRTMRSPDMAPQASSIFGDITAEELRSGIRHLEKVTDEEIRRIVNLTASATENPEDLVTTLIARKKNAIRQARDEIRRLEAAKTGRVRTAQRLDPAPAPPATPHGIATPAPPSAPIPPVAQAPPVSAPIPPSIPAAGAPDISGLVAGEKLKVAALKVPGEQKWVVQSGEVKFGKFEKVGNQFRADSEMLALLPELEGKTWGYTGSAKLAVLSALKKHGILDKGGFVVSVPTTAAQPPILTLPAGVKFTDKVISVPKVPGEEKWIAIAFETEIGEIRKVDGKFVASAALIEDLPTLEGKQWAHSKSVKLAIISAMKKRGILNQEGVVI